MLLPSTKFSSALPSTSFCPLTLGVTVSIPIFDNRKNKSAVERAKVAETTAQLDLQDTQKQLYQTISEELKKVNKGHNVNGIFNSQLAESKQAKQSLVETTMYKSEKVNEALDFMKRLDNIK